MQMLQFRDGKERLLHLRLDLRGHGGISARQLDRNADRPRIDRDGFDNAKRDNIARIARIFDRLERLGDYFLIKHNKARHNVLRAQQG